MRGGGKNAEAKKAKIRARLPEVSSADFKVSFVDDIVWTLDKII